MNAFAVGLLTSKHVGFEPFSINSLTRAHRESLWKCRVTLHATTESSSLLRGDLK
jgi:hypothetical protein